MTSARAQSLLACLTFAAAPLAAQEPAFLVLDAPAGTEAMAYGDAPWLFAGSPDLLFYAPELLAGTSGVSAALHRFGSEGTGAALAGVGTLQDGGIAVGLRYLRYGVDLGDPPGFGRQSRAVRGGETAIGELAATIGYGRTVFGVRAGASVSLLERTEEGDDARGFAVDLGLARDFGDLRIHAGARNLGPDIEPSAGPDLELPTLLVVGASLGSFQVGELDMLVTSQVARRRDGEIIPAGGLEVSYWPVAGYTFRIRAGLQRTDDDRSPVTLGAAFSADDFTLEYAFQPFDDGGSGHRFGIRWR